jgi:MYXO-CTERM domain-containing protein
MPRPIVLAALLGVGAALAARRRKAQRADRHVWTEALVAPDLR